MAAVLCSYVTYADQYCLSLEEQTPTENDHDDFLERVRFEGKVRETKILKSKLVIFLNRPPGDIVRPYCMRHLHCK